MPIIQSLGEKISDLRNFNIEFYRINSVNWSDVEGMGLYSMDDSNQKRIRIWLLLSGVVAFGSIFAAVWIAVAHWFTNEKTPFSNWPGVALILQNVLIFLSGITYRYAKPPPGDEYNTF
jgi:heme/copper-type cytochrome/quinol oxidase subunit 3